MWKGLQYGGECILLKAKKMIVDLDIYKEMSYGTVIDNGGRLIKRRKAHSTYDGICALLEKVLLNSCVALESTTSAYGIYGQLKSMGYEPHLANPLKVRVIAELRLKSGKADFEACGTAAHELAARILRS